MPADAGELVLLQGWAVTGVTQPTEQDLMAQGYGVGEGVILPTGDDPAPTADFDAAVAPVVNLDSV